VSKKDELNEFCGRKPEVKNFIKYGNGNVAYMEEMGGYVVRYEARTVTDLMYLIESIHQRNQRLKLERQGQAQPEVTPIIRDSVV
jgi:hypothetical protein